MNSIDIVNNMITVYRAEQSKGRETGAQDGYRAAEDWLNEYRYTNVIDDTVITSVMNIWEQWLAQFPEWQ